MRDLFLYNTLTRKKEKFEPLNSPHVGMYVCGPTVYGDAHLGHARGAISFDIVYRYLTHLGYKVRYVRNITDVGHLVGDGDTGEDKIQKKAQIEQLEPMEVAQYFINRYHENMRSLNLIPPSIEPRATGHIMEQLDLIDKIYENGYAYESNGSVYFDVMKFNQKYNYGRLSGRKIDDLLENTRELQGQEEKHNQFDFALWKKADETHLMRWNSHWSNGYPGWHLECSAMGQKYLGMQFDIHGGGLDLQFPHHESEIAQSMAAYGKDPVRYWMHNNMITINGQKMSKSLNNFISLYDIFSGNNQLLEQAYNPMTVRFFILQAHYRSPLDFSNDALKAAQKGLERLTKVFETLKKVKTAEKSSIDVNKLIETAYTDMSDDFNTPVLIADLFEIVRIVNSTVDGKEQLSKEDLERISDFLRAMIVDVLGLKIEASSAADQALSNDLMNVILQIRQKVKSQKDYATSDFIRDELNKLGIIVKDTKDGFEWEIKK